MRAAPMRTVITTLLLLSAQWIAGGLALGAASLPLLGPRRPGRAIRRRAITRRRALRWLFSGIPPALGVMIACQAALELAWGDLPGPRLSLALGAPAPFLVAAGLSIAGCLVMIQGGFQESRGKLASARRLGRLGGRTGLLGAAAALLLLAFDLFLGVNPVGPTRITAAVLLACAGSTALLGGLAGKPRPSGWFAATFHVAAMASLVAAV